MEPQRAIELLSPARDSRAAFAAIDCGADAVYMGGPALGARRDARNTVADISCVVRYARPFGARVYATMNTLVMESELAQARDLALELIDAGVDALIIQDPCYLRMGLKGVELHSSTQMFNASARKAGFWHSCGLSRVILERNLSLKEIRDICSSTDAEIECFVHGAVCVCYSGCCSMSLSQGRGSANRGECSQPCRLPYDLADGSGKVLLKGRHLLSVADLNLSERIGDLMDAGVGSFKIEGRLKDESYVRNVTLAYRRAIDDALKSRPSLRRASAGETVTDFRADLSKSFSRAGGTYFLDGPRAGVACMDSPKATGEYVGKAVRLSADSFILEGGAALSPGDGICYLSDGALSGTGVNAVRNGRVYPNSMGTLKEGSPVYRNQDRAFLAQLQSERIRRCLDASVTASSSSDSLTLTMTSRGHSVSVRAQASESASNPQRMRAMIMDAVSRTGESVFRVTSVSVPESDTFPFLRQAELNSLRRKLTELLREAVGSDVPERRLMREDPAVRYPLVPDESVAVTNSLAARFWADHGAEPSLPAAELCGDLTGRRVMRTRYCIRREVGLCPKAGGRPPKELYISHGRERYRLEFDCAACQMSIVKV